MNEFDRLEEELASFRPHDPSMNLKQRIANGLEPNLQPPSDRRQSHPGRNLAIAVGLVAATVALLLWHRNASITIQGTRRRVCSGLTRRDVIRVGGAGLLGTSRPVFFGRTHAGGTTLGRRHFVAGLNNVAGVVIVLGVRHRANDREPIRQRRKLWQSLAN